MAKLNLNRRELLKLGATIPLMAHLPGTSHAMGKTGLGAMELTILSDGNLQLPLGFAFPDVPQPELEAVLTQSGQSTSMLLPDCNLTLLRYADNAVLFDVGAGPNFMPSAGKILESMDEASLDPAEITDVVFTHAHPDHIWGLVDDFDELVFANANYHINQIEWDYWRKDDTLEKTPESRQTFVIGARNRFEYLEDRINLFSFGDEVLPGIEAVDTSGHTPGHTSFALYEGSDSLLIVGDAVTNIAVSFEHPEWPSGSDQDPEKGIMTRNKLLDRLATDRMGMVGFHMPHPGIGRVETKGVSYRFVAET